MGFNYRSKGIQRYKMKRMRDLEPEDIFTLCLGGVPYIKSDNNQSFISLNSGRKCWAGDYDKNKEVFLVDLNCDVVYQKVNMSGGD